MDTVYLKDRIKYALKYTKLTKKVEFKQKYLIKDKILGRGYQGTVYKYCYNNDDCKNKDFLAVKKIYLNQKESKYIDDALNIKAFKYGNYIELASSILVNQLLFQNISQNFIFNYSHEYIERDGICSDKYPYSSYHFNEYIDNAITFGEWITYPHQVNELYNAYFQIVSGVYALQKYFNMTHLDLHGANILVKTVKKGGYWEYIIHDNTYIVPNLGYVFYIGDFGQASLKKTKYKIHKSFDIYTLFKSTIHKSVSSDTFKKNIKKFIKKVRLSDSTPAVIYEFWGLKYQYSNDKDIIERFDMTKKLKIKDINIKLRHFVTHN